MKAKREEAIRLEEAAKAQAAALAAALAAKLKREAALAAKAIRLEEEAALAAKAEAEDVSFAGGLSLDQRLENGKACAIDLTDENVLLELEKRYMRF